MSRLVECVPNFSEGRDKTKIDQITLEIQTTEGIKLLDVDPGRDTNRTVVTFIGPPETVLEAAFKAIAKAAEILDMSKHSGAHARMGATDVCPFIPVSGVTMEECTEMARSLAKRVGEELKIPVYLYEEAASNPGRRNLADIRAGEYEGLPLKLKDPRWKPDYGPAKFNERTGATVIGAREFLIAYNINLNTRDQNIARNIAFTIREKGRLKRDKDDKTILDSDGTPMRTPGKFKACKAVGWYMDDFGRAQISINLTNYKITPPHLVFDACCRLAESLGTRVTGSELVGLIPLQALLDAGRYFMQKQGKTTGVPEAELIHIAVLSMGLNDLYPFEKTKKVIEYQIEKPESLTALSLQDFADILSSESPAPGGGSVAALCGALSSALSSMVAALTHGKKKYESVWQEMDQIGNISQRLKDIFMNDVDRDTRAFNQVLDAMRLSKKTEEEKCIREKALETAMKEATRVPMEVLRRSREAVSCAKLVIEKGNTNSISDGAVAALTAKTAAVGAYLNVLINLSGIEDSDFCRKMSEEAIRIRDEVVQQAEDALRMTESTILKKY